MPGKYHAAVSCYMGGKVSCNFGPKFKFPLRKGKPLCQASALVFAPEIAPLLQQNGTVEVTDKTGIDEIGSDLVVQHGVSNENDIIDSKDIKEGNGSFIKLEDSPESRNITQDLKDSN